MMNIKVGGKFRLVAVKPDGSERVLADWFDNLILDSGLDRIATRLTAADVVRVGSGTTPPVVTDTALEAQIASTSAWTNKISGNATSAPYYGWSRVTFRFAAGVAAGNISEVGVGWDLTGPTLFSRSLIKNSSGTPITITVLPDEVLDVTYEIRLYAPVADVPYSVTIASIEHTGVARAAQVTGSWWQPTCLISGGSSEFMSARSGAIGDVTQVPSGSGTDVGVVFDAYVPGSFYRDCTGTFALNDANFGAGGVQALAMRTNYVGHFQFSLTPAIMKDNTKIMSIKMRLSWSRYTPA